MRRLFLINHLAPLIVLSSVVVPYTAFADGAAISMSMEIGAGTHLTDRGETLAAEHTHANITATAHTGHGAAYAALGTITPTSAKASQYDDEIAYSIGYVFERERYALDLSVNRLTYPESSGGDATELVADATFSHPLAPQLTAFYAADSRDYGIEGRIGHTIESGAWAFSANALAGMVAVNNDNDRYYTGLEASATAAISTNIDLQGYAFITAANRSTFVPSYSSDNQPKLSREASGAGLRLFWKLE